MVYCNSSSINNNNNNNVFIHVHFNRILGGGTPLCRHIREVTEKVKAMEADLRATGNKVAIIIMTDGEASDGDLAAAMKPLQQLPVWVVVRLCTDDESVVNYWNGIDEHLEIDMEVLDDMLGESTEIHPENPWLTYSEPFHRMREFGVHLKELDLIDEKLLSPDQVRMVCSVLFDVPPADIPHPEAEPDAFIHRIDALNRENPRIYSLKHRRMLPFVDTAQLKRSYGKKGGCVIS
jgi:hypothetical protein